MPNYLLAYHGGKMPESPTEQAAVMKAWEAWMAQLGKGLVDGGNPVGKTKTIGKDGKATDGGGANPVSGYSIIKVDNFEQAVKAAGMCPVLQGGATVEVCETFEAM